MHRNSLWSMHFWVRGLKDLICSLASSVVRRLGPECNGVHQMGWSRVKLDFLQRLPWALAGVAHDDTTKAQTCAARLLQEFDACNRAEHLFASLPDFVVPTCWVSCADGWLQLCLNSSCLNTTSLFAVSSVFRNDALKGPIPWSREEPILAQLFWRGFFFWLDVVAQGFWFINTSLLCKCEHPPDEAFKGDSVIASMFVWIGS